MAIARVSHRLKEYGLSRFMRLEYDFMEGAIKPIPEVEKDLQKLGYRYKEGCLNPLSRVKVENMNADVLLLAVENDDCWPSEVATRRIVKKFHEADYRKKLNGVFTKKAAISLLTDLTNLASWHGFWPN